MIFCCNLTPPFPHAPHTPPPDSRRARVGIVESAGMTIKTWLDWAVQDAERRGVPPLKPLLETLARSTSALRSADWNDDATGEHEGRKDADVR
jgi:hypothetical protein